MRTRPDWPQDQFLAWLDAVKAELGLRSDLQLADRLGIGHTLISGWRNGRQRPSMAILSTIAGAIGEDPRRLWVLAGITDPKSAGLIAADVEAKPPLPAEFRELIDFYNTAELTDGERLLLRTQARGAVLAVRAMVHDRVGPDRPRSRRRTA